MSFAADMRAFASGFKSGMASMGDMQQQAETKRHNIATEGIQRERSSDPTIGYPGYQGGSGGGTTGSTGGGGKVDTNANGQTLMKYFTDLGYSKEGAAGIVGNLHAESKLNPTVKPGDEGTAFGIAQWRGNRWANMQRWAKSQGLDPNSLTAQAGFVDQELRAMPGVRNSLMKATDPNAATDLFALKFERPKGAETGDAANIHNIGGRRAFAGGYFKGFNPSGGGTQTASTTTADPSSTGSTTTAPAAKPAPAAAAKPRPATTAPADTTDTGQGVGDAKAILADPLSNEGMKEQARRTLQKAGISVSENTAIPAPGAAPGAAGFNPLGNAAVQLASAQPDEEEEDQPMLFAQGGGAIPHFAAGGTVKKAAPKKVAPPKGAGKINPHVENKKVYGTAANAGAIDYYDWLDENTRRRAAGTEEAARPDEFRERPTWVASIPTIEGGRYAPGSIGGTGRAYLQGAPGNTMATQVYKNAFTPGKITTAEGKVLDPIAIQKAWGDQFRARQAENAALWDAYSRGGTGAGTPAQGPAKFYPAGSQGPHGETVSNPGGLWSTDLPGAAAKAAPRPTMPWDYRGMAVSGQEGLSRAGDYWDRPTTAAPKTGASNPAGAAAAAAGGGGGFQNFSGGSGGGGGQPVAGDTPVGPTDQRYGGAGNQFAQQGAKPGQRQPGVNGMYMPAMAVSDQWNFQTGTSQPTASMPAGTGGWWGWEDGGPVLYKEGGGVFYFEGGLVRYRNGGPVRYEEGGAVAGAIPSPAPFRHFAEGGSVEPTFTIQRGGSEAQSPDPITLAQARQRITDRQQAYKVGLTQGDIDRAKSDPSRYGPYYGPKEVSVTKPAKKDPTTTGSVKPTPPLPPKRPEESPPWPRPVDPDRFKRDEPEPPDPTPTGTTPHFPQVDPTGAVTGPATPSAPASSTEGVPVTQAEPSAADVPAPGSQLASLDLGGNEGYVIPGQEVGSGAIPGDPRLKLLRAGEDDIRVPNRQGLALAKAVGLARGGPVPHFEGGGGMDPDSVYGANANYAAAVQRGATPAPTQGLPGTPGAIPTPGAPPNAIAPPSANSMGQRPADQNAGPAPPPSEATVTNTPRPKERTGYYQMPDAEEIARLNKLGLDTMTATLETRARSAEGAIPSQDGQAHKEILANAFGSNALAPTSGDMKVAYDAVDPERKLSSDELTMKTLQDMTDYWYAHGRPDKAGQAAMSLMLYGKKVATGAGQQARAAFEDGDVAKGLEWLQKGYSYIPDGRTAQYKVGPDGKSAEVWFVNPDGSETDHQQMDGNGLRNLSLAMSNGSAWMQASQGAISGMSGRGGGRGQFSEQKRAEDQGAIDKLQAAGRAWQKNPDDPEAKRAYEDAYDDAIATTGRAALVKQADTEFRPERYKKTGKPSKSEADDEKFETGVKRDEEELDTQIKAATDDRTKKRLTTEKTWVRPTAAFNRQKVDQSVDRKGLASITEERDDADKVSGTYQELGENVLQRNPLSARTVVRLFDQLRSGAEPKVMPDGRVQVPGFAPLYLDMYTLKSLAKLGRFEPAK